MLSFLALGFLIGLRHALEPDHVAAVVSITSGGGGLRDHARSGALWGAGHALTLLLLAGTCVAFELVIPEAAGRLLEGAVGAMLVWLGISVFARMRARGVHAHGHVHPDGTAHFHAHSHAPRLDPSRERHEHSHRRPALRTFLVGTVHGLAGSSALALLVGRSARTPALGLAYIALFAAGAILGMTALAATIALPLGRKQRAGTRLLRSIDAVVGVGSIAIGLHLVWVVAAAGSS